jgi:hypothetical protein
MDEKQLKGLLTKAPGGRRPVRLTSSILAEPDRVRRVAPARVLGHADAQVERLLRKGGRRGEQRPALSDLE